MTNTKPTTERDNGRITMDRDEERIIGSIEEHLYEALKSQDETEKHRHIRESLQLVESLEERK